MKEKIRKCNYCNKEFVYTNERNIYCSRNCGAKHSRENKWVLVKKNCKNCNISFESVGASKTFCCNKCKIEYYIRNPIKHKYNLICKNCGKSFVKILVNKPKTNENHYCSQACIAYNKNRIGIGKSRPCKECGKEFWQIHKRHFFCCEKCKITYGTKHVIMKKVFCSTCGAEISRIRNLKRKNFFCSRKCEGIFRENQANEIRICRYCKKEFICKKHEKLVFCSKSCQICGMNKSPTVPHKTILKFIECLNIPFEIEKPIKRYSVDIYLNKTNLSLEVMGQYWHCDNRKYSKPTNPVHRDAIRKDKKKNLYFKKASLPILYLWEIDINKNLEVCKKLILEFIKNCGILYNYHSMNYSLVKGKLVLNDYLLIPYFER